MKIIGVLIEHAWEAVDFDVLCKAVDHICERSEQKKPSKLGHFGPQSTRWIEDSRVCEVDVDVELSVETLRNHAEERFPVLVRDLFLVGQGGRFGNTSAQKPFGQELLKFHGTLDGKHEQLVVDLQLAFAHHVAQFTSEAQKMPKFARPMLPNDQWSLDGHLPGHFAELHRQTFAHVPMGWKDAMKSFLKLGQVLLYPRIASINLVQPRVLDRTNNIEQRPRTLQLSCEGSLLDFPRRARRTR